LNINEEDLTFTLFFNYFFNCQLKIELFSQINFELMMFLVNG